MGLITVSDLGWLGQCSIGFREIICGIIIVYLLVTFNDKIKEKI